MVRSWTCFFRAPCIWQSLRRCACVSPRRLLEEFHTCLGLGHGIRKMLRTLLAWFVAGYSSCVSHGDVCLLALFAHGNWTLFLRSPRVRHSLVQQASPEENMILDFSGDASGKRLPVRRMLGLTLDTSTCISLRWHLEEFHKFPTCKWSLDPEVDSCWPHVDPEGRFSAEMRLLSDSVHSDVESQRELSMANSSWSSRAGGDAGTLTPMCSATRIPWPSLRTTPPQGDRRWPGSGREWSTSSTTAYGHRSLHSWGCGRAVSLTLGRSGVTAPCGTPRGKHLSWWWRRWLAATKLTPPPSLSSCAST